MARIGIGVLGLGFMGGTHVSAVHAAVKAGLPCRLAAVCDGDPGRLAGHAAAAGNLVSTEETAIFDPRGVATYTDPEALFADRDVHVVHICTWTDTHVDLATRAMVAGKHVVVEKPVALRSEDVAHLAQTARRLGRICMPAMCMRWWPGWDWLKGRIDAARGGGGEHGAVRSAVFRRVGAPPAWAPFYGDEARSGGALFDLHIHDADFILWSFGMPEAVASTGTLRHLTSLYRYPGGPPHVVAEGGWALTPAAGFRMQYQVCFERAVAEFDLVRTPPLVVHHEDRTEPILVPPGTGYPGEVAAMIEAVASGDASRLPTLDEALAVTRLLEAERRALTDGEQRLERP